MKQLKNTLQLCCFLLLAVPSIWSQQQARNGHVTLLKKNGQAKTTEATGIGHVTLLKRNALLIYVGGGSESPTADVKDVALPNSLTTISEEIYKPLWVKRNFSLGLNIGGQYLFTNSDPIANDAIPQPYHIYSETSSTVAVERRGNPSVQGFKLGLGPQVNFHLGNRFIVSPIFNVGYLNITQKAFNAVQTSDVNTTIYKYNLLSRSETKTDGMAIMPKLRLHYFFTKWLGIWAEAAYTVGPTINTVTDRFTPQGEPLIDTNNYELQAMELGTTTRTQTETKYNAVGINAGLVFAIGGNREPKPEPEPEPVVETTSRNGHVTLLKKNEAALTRTSNRNCTEYSAPQITSPRQGENQKTKSDELYIDYKSSNAVWVNYKVVVWRDNKGKKEMIHDQTYRSNFNGKITGLKLSKDKIESLSIQMQAIPCSTGDCLGDNSDKAAYQKAGCITFENGGLSKVVHFSVQGNECIPVFVRNITKTECIEGGKLKISGNYRANLSTTQMLQSLALDSLIVKVDGQIIPAANFSTAATNLPLSFLPNQQYDYSFEIDGGDYCGKELAVKLYFGYALNCGTVSNPDIVEGVYGCQAVYENLPCCICKYCDQPENMVLTMEENASATVSNGLLSIQQSATVNPKSISKITAQIVAIKEYEVDDACKTCRKNLQGQLAENEVYHFVGDNTVQWTTGAAITAQPGNGIPAFPTKILEWKTNKKGGIVFDLDIALPGTAALACCERHGKICIRYSFTDAECKTCDKLVCYEY